jgi:hypothetical protein
MESVPEKEGLGLRFAELKLVHGRLGGVEALNINRFAVLWPRPDNRRGAGSAPEALVCLWIADKVIGEEFESNEEVPKVTGGRDRSGHGPPSRATTVASARHY